MLVSALEKSSKETGRELMKDAIADFAHYLLRLSVIQMMQQTNPPFQVAQESSIATLTDIAQHCK
jgi:hypothetical protein